MKRVYLIRHGMPDFPPGARMCLGTTDLGLGAEGFAQARQMAAALPPVSAVFSSGLSRAVQTAQAIADPTILPGLGELYAGEWDGLTFEEIRRRFPELYAARGTDKRLPLPGAEPDAEGLSRFRTALTQAAESAAGDLAVVAHAGVLALFLESIGLGRYKPRYCEIISIFYEGGTFHA